MRATGGSASRSPKQYNTDGIAGLVSRRKAQETGRLVGLYHAAQAGLEDDPETPWATVCEEHATLVCHATLKQARAHAANPLGWCEECQT